MNERHRPIPGPEPEWQNLCTDKTVVMQDESLLLEPAEEVLDEKLLKNEFNVPEDMANLTDGVVLADDDSEGGG